jgi:bifunctional non-homologous end joining protein LigD
MHDALASLSDDVKKKLKKTDQPDWVNPMLATLTDDHFSDPNWIYERKLDGERCIAYREGDDVRLMSRNRKSLNVQYPELVDAIRRQPVDHFIVDGEVVAFDGNLTSFERLQNRMNLADPAEVSESDVDVFYYLFDLVYFDGYDLTNLPLHARKSVLKSAFDYGDPLRLSRHRNEDGAAYYKEACQDGWEGLIAKRADSPYVHSRSKKWLKFKCVNQQELVVGGYTDPHGKRIRFGALLLGYYDGGDLVYAGKVGTGFDRETLNDLGDRMADLARDDPPFDEGDLPHKEVHWVEPELVAEIGFTEWTDEGRLRHPRYLGLRQDKPPEDVVKEVPA